MVPMLTIRPATALYLQRVALLSPWLNFLEPIVKFAVMSKAGARQEQGVAG
jgi:hypothetical protein